VKRWAGGPLGDEWWAAVAELAENAAEDGVELRRDDGGVEILLYRRDGEQLVNGGTLIIPPGAFGPAAE
jgi:hypothetical protein